MGAGFARDPLGFLTQLAAERGAVARFRVGRRDVLLVADPATARDVLVTRNRLFAKQNFVPGGARTPGFKPGAMMSDDPRRHVAGRRRLQPAFDRERLATVDRVAREESERVSTGWGDGESVDVGRAMSAISIETVGRALFDAPFGERVPELIEDSEQFLGAFRLVTSRGRSALDLLRLGRGLRFLRAYDRSRGVHRERLASAPPDGESVPSLLAHAHEVSDDDRLAEAFAVFLAGIETTSVALTWAAWLLATHEDESARLRAEPARSAAVFAEALRLYPPAWYVGRRTLEDTDVGGHRLAAGSIVLVCPYLVHRDPRLHPDPVRFRPDRWLDGTRAARAAFSYLPFGGGPRQCIGEVLATLEGCAVLETLAGRLRFEPIPGAPEPVPWAGASLAPAQPLRLRAITASTGPR